MFLGDFWLTHLDIPREKNHVKMWRRVRDVLSEDDRQHRCKQTSLLGKYLWFMLINTLLKGVFVLPCHDDCYQLWEYISIPKIIIIWMLGISNMKLSCILLEKLTQMLLSSDRQQNTGRTCRPQLIVYDNESGILGGKQSMWKQKTVLESNNTEVNVT